MIICEVGHLTDTNSSDEVPICSDEVKVVRKEARWCFRFDPLIRVGKGKSIGKVARFGQLAGRNNPVFRSIRPPRACYKYPGKTLEVDAESLDSPVLELESTKVYQD